MHWTFTSSADRKVMSATSDAYYILGEVAQQLATDDIVFNERIQFRSPHVTIYGPTSSENSLALQRVSTAQALEKHGIDLTQNGGARILCDLTKIYVDIYVGRNNFDRIMPEIERTLENDKLALSLTFQLPMPSVSQSGSDAEFEQAKFLSSQAIFFNNLPEMQLVKKFIP